LKGRRVGGFVDFIDGWWVSVWGGLGGKAGVWLGLLRPILYRRNNGYHSVAADAFAKLVSVLRTRVCRIAWAKIVGSGSIASRPL